MLMRSLSLLLFLLVFVLACQNGDSTSATATDGTTSTDTPTTTAEKPKTKYQLTPFTPSPEFEDAELKTMTYINDTWNFDIASSTYQLGVQTTDAPQKMCANSDKGQHIHLIIDNQPYKAKYTSSFNDVKMENGEYHVLAFLSRSYHESIKNGKAFKALKVSVEDGLGKKFESINAPMLFYSRPKGAYVGKKNTDKVMLDFYVINAELGAKGYKVKANINGEEDHILEEWKPFYIEGLPMGKNTITLTLLDKDGNAVDAPFNPVSREFELKADALE